MTHGLLSTCIISQDIGIVCLNVMFFHCFCWFPDSGFLVKTILFDVGRELNLIKRHFVSKIEFLFSENCIFWNKAYFIIKEHGL